MCQTYLVLLCPLNILGIRINHDMNPHLVSEVDNLRSLLVLISVPFLGVNQVKQAVTALQRFRNPDAFRLRQSLSRDDYRFSRFHFINYVSECDK